MRLYFLLAALLLATALALLEQWAIVEHLYYRYPWFDVLMHLIGGALTGSFLAAVLLPYRPMFFLALATAVLAGWEVFEYLIGVPREMNFIFDSALDLLMGALGVLAAYAIARNSLWSFISRV